VSEALTRATVVRLVCAVAACAATATAFALAATQTRRPVRRAAGGVLIPSYPGETLRFSGGTVPSANWSGYVVRSKHHTISGISGTFVVPSVSSLDLGTAVTWAGIGGFKTSDLIQAGTTEEGRAYGRQYYAWYELLAPHNGVTALQGCRGDRRCKVSPGDHISVNIHQISGGNWSISVDDRSRWNWARQFHYNSSRSSAEWILEAPSSRFGVIFPLAHVGTVRFGPTSTYTASGASHTIAQGHPIRIILKGGRATPSPLASDRQSFNDCSYKSSCSRP
jgi:hypothetical protein